MCRSPYNRMEEEEEEESRKRAGSRNAVCRSPYNTMVGREKGPTGRDDTSIEARTSTVAAGTSCAEEDEEEQQEAVNRVPCEQEHRTPYTPCTP